MSEDDIIILSSGSEEERKPKRTAKSVKRRIPLKSLPKHVPAKKKAVVESDDEVEEITEEKEEENGASSDDQRNRPGPSKAKAKHRDSNVDRSSANPCKRRRTNDTSDAQDSGEDDDIAVVKVVNSADDPTFKSTWDKLVNVAKEKMEGPQFQNFIEKFLHKINRLNFKCEGVLNRAIDQVNEVLLYWERKPEKIWKPLAKLREDLWQLEKNQIKIIKDSKKQKKNSGTSFEQMEKKRQKRILELEGGMERTDRMIRKYELLEYGGSDCDDEEMETMYRQEELMKKRFIKYHAEWCKLQKLSQQTSRPIEQKISLDKVTPYETVNQKVANFINRKHNLFMPDFGDVRKIVEAELKILSLPEDSWHAVAVKLFERVVELTKQKRGEDFKVAFAHVEELPLESDDELQRKLDENLRSMKSEHEVISKFAKDEAELKIEPDEVPDDIADESAPESQDEEEDEDSVSDEDDILKRALISDEGSANKTDEENHETAGPSTKINTSARKPEREPIPYVLSEITGSISAADDLLQTEKEDTGATDLKAPLAKRIRQDATVIAGEYNAECVEAKTSAQTFPNNKGETTEVVPQVTEREPSVPHTSVVCSGSDDVAEVI